MEFMHPWATIPFIASSQSSIVVDGVHASMGHHPIHRVVAVEHRSRWSSCVHWPWKKRDKMTTQQQQHHESVSRSVTQLLRQPASHHHPSIVFIIRNKTPQSSIIRANHASRWLVYVQMQSSRRACMKSSSAWTRTHISLHHTARTDQ